MFPILQQRIDDKARQVDHTTTSLTFRIGLDKLSSARIRMRNIRKRALNTKFGFFKINITPAQRQELATAQTEKRDMQEASHTKRASTCYQFLRLVKTQPRRGLQRASLNAQPVLQVVPKRLIASRQQLALLQILQHPAPGSLCLRTRIVVLLLLFSTA